MSHADDEIARVFKDLDVALQRAEEELHQASLACERLLGRWRNSLRSEDEEHQKVLQ